MLQIDCTFIIISIDKVWRQFYHFVEVGNSNSYVLALAGSSNLRRLFGNGRRNLFDSTLTIHCHCSGEISKRKVRTQANGCRQVVDRRIEITHQHMADCSTEIVHRTSSVTFYHRCIMANKLKLQLDLLFAEISNGVGQIEFVAKIVFGVDNINFFLVVRVETQFRGAVVIR